MKVEILNSIPRWAMPAALAIAISPVLLAVLAQSPLPSALRGEAENQAVYAAGGEPDAASAKEALDPEAERFLRRAVAASRQELDLLRLGRTRASSESVTDFARTLENDHREVSGRLRLLARQEGVVIPDAILWTPPKAKFQPGGNQPYTGMGPSGHPSMTSPDAEAHLPMLEPVTPGTTSTVPGQTERDQAAAAPVEPVPPDGAIDRSVESDRAMAAGRAVRNQDMKSLKEYRGPAFDMRFLDLEIAHHQELIRLYERAASSVEDAEVRQFAKDALPLLREHLQAAESLYAQRPGLEDS